MNNILNTNNQENLTNSILLSNQENMTLETYSILEFNKDDVIFTGEKIHKRFNVEGVEFILDFNVNNLNSQFKKELTVDVVNKIVASFKKLPTEIKTALSIENFTISLRDFESLTFEMNDYDDATGFYCYKNKEIHIALLHHYSSEIIFYHEIGHFIDNALYNIHFRTGYFASGYFCTKNLTAHKAFKLESQYLDEYGQTDLYEFTAVAFETYLFDNTSLDTLPLTKKFVIDFLLMLHDRYVLGNSYLSKGEFLKSKLILPTNNEEHFEYVEINKNSIKEDSDSTLEDDTDDFAITETHDVDFGDITLGVVKEDNGSNSTVTDFYDIDFGDITLGVI